MALAIIVVLAIQLLLCWFAAIVVWVDFIVRVGFIVVWVGLITV